jgi:hypothetical protein
LFALKKKTDSGITEYKAKEESEEKGSVVLTNDVNVPCLMTMKAHLL